MIIENYRVDGMLFIGDPHISSYKPGRRLESEATIIDVTVDKLEQSIVKANELNCVPIILGDLFDKSKDSKARLMTLLFKALRRSKHPVLCLPGNHDLLANDVTDDTALAAVEASGLIHLMHHSNTLCASFIIGDTFVLLGSTLHGDEIINDIRELNQYKPDAHVVWVTHHDIAFEGAYPGSIDPYPIEGCRLVVNGHMHRTKPSILRGNTWWCNPGNIFRQTIADAKHVPAVWEWAPKMETPKRHVLKYDENVFDWTGRVSGIQITDTLTPLVNNDNESEFVEKLSAALAGEMPKTSTGDILKEDMQAVQDAINPSCEVLTIIDALHKKCILVQ